MTVIGIIANGPLQYVPNLLHYDKSVDLWIGVDRGTLTLIENNMAVHYAIGDFDSINQEEKDVIFNQVKSFQQYPSEKNETDLEIAIEKAIDLQPEKIYFFGVTGGRIDHTLINIQLLERVLQRQIRAMMIDKWNRIELTNPGTYKIYKDEQFPYISFIPYSDVVEGISLTGFHYLIDDFTVKKGSTRCISNTINSTYGTLSYKEGNLLIIESKDAT